MHKDWPDIYIKHNFASKKTYTNCEFIASISSLSHYHAASAEPKS
jgi:hypothetical protein